MVEKSSAFVITRVFDAPRERVWKAWTEAERLKRWWGPKGFTVHTCKVDLRPGGVFHYGMRAPDGSDMWGKFIYREIVAPERLVFIVSFSDKDAGVPRHPWSPNWPLQTLSTVMFEEHGEKLVLTEQDVFLDGIDSVAAREQGTRDLLDNLDKYVSQP